MFHVPAHKSDSAAQISYAYNESNVAPVDFSFRDEASICLLEPQTRLAEQWAEAHLPDSAMTFGRAIVIEHRFAGAILEGLTNDGLSAE